MPRTALTKQAVSLTVPAAQQAEQNSDQTNGNFIADNTGRITVFVRNSGASVRTVTFLTGAVFEGSAVADDGPHSIPVGETWVFGPFSTSKYNQPEGANADELWIDVSHTDIKFRVFEWELPRRSQ